MEVPKDGKGWIFLNRKGAVEGGSLGAYMVQRKECPRETWRDVAAVVMRHERPAGPWEEVATAVVSEATLVEQPRGKEFEYRIVAVNKAGEGEPSNTAMVVL